jgi:hypothetical protein
MSGGVGDRLAAILGLVHVVAFRFKDRGQRGAHHGIIVGNENTLAIHGDIGRGRGE